MKKRKPLTEEQKLAHKERSRLYYQRNKEKIKQRTSDYGKNNRTLTRKASKKFRSKKYNEFIEFKKTLSCIKCGESDYNCLDFHHTDPSVREDNISNIYHSTGKFQEELKKCVVLCANCHRKAHAYKDFLKIL